MTCEIEFHLDYLTFTVHELPDYQVFWSETFEKKLGKLVQLGHGGRGYKEFYTTGTGANLYRVPVNGGEYFTIEIKGEGCSCLVPDDFQDIVFLMRGGLRVNVARIDLAFDRVPFTPDQVYQEMINDRMTCKASRSSIRRYESPFKQQENNGGLGCYTAYIGAPSSERMMRVYNEHGFNRLELQLKDAWANNAFGLVVGSPVKDWFMSALSVLTNYIRFDTDWWYEFVGCSVPADIRVYSARVRSLGKLQSWIAKQVAPAAFVLYAIGGLDEFWSLIASNVSSRRLDKYQTIMQLAGVTMASDIKPMGREIVDEG